MCGFSWNTTYAKHGHVVVLSQPMTMSEEQQIGKRQNKNGYQSDKIKQNLTCLKSGYL